MPFWTNKTGCPIRISEMTDDYLSNCISLVEKNYERYLTGVAYCNSFNIHLFSCDEEYFIEHELNIEEKFPVYKDLVNELRSRKK